MKSPVTATPEGGVRYPAYLVITAGIVPAVGAGQRVIALVDVLTLPVISLSHTPYRIFQ